MVNFDPILAYDFKHFFAGYVGNPGTRRDVELSRDYTFSVVGSAGAEMARFNDHPGAAMAKLDFINGNPAFRYAIEQVRDACTLTVVDTREDRPSMVDVHASAHCEEAVQYLITH